jgi:transposase
MQNNFTMPLSNLQEILNLKGTVVNKMDIFKKNIFFDIASTSEFSHCPDCAFPAINVHEYKTYTVRDLSILGRKCYLRVRKKGINAIYVVKCLQRYWSLSKVDNKCKGIWN